MPIAEAGPAGDLRMPPDKKGATVPEPAFTGPLDPVLDEGSACPLTWAADPPLDSRAFRPLRLRARLPLELGLVRGCLGERDDDGVNGAPCAAPYGPTPATGTTGFAWSADANELIPVASDL